MDQAFSGPARGPEKKVRRMSPGSPPGKENQSRRQKESPGMLLGPTHRSARTLRSGRKKPSSGVVHVAQPGIDSGVRFEIISVGVTGQAFRPHFVEAFEAVGRIGQGRRTDVTARAVVVHSR